MTVPISVLDGLPYLHGERALLSKSCSDACGCTNCAHAYNLSVLSPHNENLTGAQKALLLDHQRLGHINIEHLRSLYGDVQRWGHR